MKIRDNMLKMKTRPENAYFKLHDRGTVTQVTDPAPRSEYAGLNIWAVLAGKIVNFHIPYDPSAISTLMLCLDKHVVHSSRRAT